MAESRTQFGEIPATLQGTFSRNVEFATKDFGYSNLEYEAVAMTQTFVPVEHRSGRVVVRVLHTPNFLVKKSEISPEPEKLLAHTPITWVHIGGASSQDASHLGDLVIRAHEALKNSSFVATNIIVLAHPDGAARSTHLNKETFNSQDFHDSAVVLDQALNDPKLQPLLQGEVWLSGLSSGGAVATQLASIREVSALVLMDPAGMEEHPHLALNFALTDALKGFKEAHQRTRSLRAAFRETMLGMQKSMTSEKGLPVGFWGFIKAMMLPDKTHQELLAAYDLKKGAATSPRIDLLEHDVTKRARETLAHTHTKVLVSPAMAAEVVNFLMVRLQWSPAELEQAAKEPHSAKAQEFVKQAKQALQAVFPGVPPERLGFQPWWGLTHSSVGSEQAYMDGIVAAMQAWQ